jgi:hypothetical protein
MVCAYSSALVILSVKLASYRQKNESECSRIVRKQICHYRQGMDEVNFVYFLRLLISLDRGPNRGDLPSLLLCISTTVESEMQRW